MTVTPEVFSARLPAARRRRSLALTFALLLLGLAPFRLGAAELAEARAHLMAGRYEEAIELAQEMTADAAAGEDWYLALAEGLLQVGRYGDAQAAIVKGLVREPGSIRLRWLGRTVARANGQPEKGEEWLLEIGATVRSQPWMYRGPTNLVTFARAALTLGSDPKDVLDRVFNPMIKAHPDVRDGYLAKGELALDKHDYALAAAAFQEGLQRLPEDADLHYGLARAYEHSDRAAMVASLQAALKSNPRHLPSLLLFADHHIVAERYSEAEDFLAEARGINPVSPEAWAYLAAVAHLRNQPAGVRLSREEALATWPENPVVDHIIGRVLSQKYRFAEGASYQRSALESDPQFLPAKAQLASDLLRLGEDAEGWLLAEEVSVRDPFNVEAFNLVTLHETMRKYSTLTSGDFVVRMTSHEAAVYGPRVLALLTRAHRVLSAKYGFEPVKPTVVEIFADQRDFAVRTFGVPDVPGYLGVCFGRVVTANSPAVNMGQPVNWESVLWHEFCHVITLQLTNNKMPRWLSEGLSVYEERQADPGWGERMNPRYRDMILAGALTPVAELSSAFLAPASPLHLQFAYFQSSLVVEFLVERFGFDRLKDILAAVRMGMDTNAAIANHTTAMANVEREFAQFARERAESLGRGLDWSQPSPELIASGDEARLAKWAEERPDNFHALLWRARHAAQARDWRAVPPLLQPVVERYPQHAGAESAWRLLAEAHRELGDTAAEKAALGALAEADGSAADALLRLMELAQAEQDWDGLALSARRFLAVNPLVAPPYRQLGQASAQLGDLPAAIEAYRTLLELDPQNPATEHYQLARWLHQTGDHASARLHVLRALEEAPRFREALSLLQDIVGRREPAPAAPATEAIPLTGS